jgi:hypothetical protein
MAHLSLGSMTHLTSDLIVAVSALSLMMPFGSSCIRPAGVQQARQSLADDERARLPLWTVVTPDARLQHHGPMIHIDRTSRAHSSRRSSSVLILATLRKYWIAEQALVALSVNEAMSLVNAFVACSLHRMLAEDVCRSPTTTQVERPIFHGSIRL